MKIYNCELVSVDKEGVESFYSIGLPICSDEEHAVRVAHINKCLSEATQPELRYVDNLNNVGYYEVSSVILDADTNTTEVGYMSNEFAQLVEGFWAKKKLEKDNYLLYNAKEKATWLEVDYSELVDLEIDEKISNKSRRNGNQIFLCNKDQKVFEKAKAKQGIKIKVVELKEMASKHVANYKAYE